MKKDAIETVRRRPCLQRFGASSVENFPRDAEGSHGTILALHFGFPLESGQIK
jgi:hypothetical protein